MVFNCGTVVESFEEIPIGCKVSKYGAASEHTEGLVNQVSVAVRGFEDALDGIQFYGQLEVIPPGTGVFATHGDSGCLTFLITDGFPYTIRALGMYIGSYGNGHCLITPIWAILNKFNLPLRLLSFQEQQQEQLMDVDERNDRWTVLENKVEDYGAAIEDIAGRVNSFGTEIIEVQCLKAGMEQFEGQFKSMQRQVIANERSTKENRRLIEKNNTSQHHKERLIQKVTPHAQASSSAASQQNRFQFGALSTGKDKTGPSKSEKGKHQEVPRTNS